MEKDIAIGKVGDLKLSFADGKAQLQLSIGAGPASLSVAAVLDEQTFAKSLLDGLVAKGGIEGEVASLLEKALGIAVTPPAPAPDPAPVPPAAA